MLHPSLHTQADELLTRHSRGCKEPASALDLFRQAAGLSHLDLWWRYFELGGMSTQFQLEACLDGVLETTAHDDVVAQALNERFVEQGGNHPVPYCTGHEGSTRAGSP